MALFFSGEDNPSDEVVEADILQLSRITDEKSGSLKNEILAHFQGKASDDQIERAIKNLLAR